MDKRILLLFALLATDAIIKAASSNSSFTLPIVVHSAAQATAFSSKANIDLWRAIVTQNLIGMQNALIARANPDALNKDGETPLSNIVSNSRNYTHEKLLELLALLINNGANPALPNQDGDVPLLDVVQRSWGLAATKILLTVYPEVQLIAKDAHGHTALHLSIGNPEIFKYLLKMGANPFIETRNKRIVLNYAIWTKSEYEKKNEPSEAIQAITRSVEMLDLSAQYAAAREAEMQKIQTLQNFPPGLLPLISSFLREQNSSEQ